MPYDSTWKALLKPGDSTDWFQAYSSIGKLKHSPEYDPAMAWLLSEISRLCYLDEKAHPAQFEETLAQANLTLLHTFQTGALKCQLYQSKGTTCQPFRILAFRGTTDIENWVTNIQTLTTPWDEQSATHRGFTQAFYNLWPMIEPHLGELVDSSYYTGHSLGAALATLAAAKHPPTALYNFGSPRVGDAAFAKHISNSMPVYRIVNHCDVVTTLPWANSLSPFEHTGECHYFDHKRKHLINPTRMELFWSNLKRDLKWNDVFDSKNIGAPVKALSDHSPINYSHALASELNALFG